MLEAALAYAARGWPVMPLHSISNGRCTCRKGHDCTSPGKHPRPHHGLKDATTDDATIRRWWMHRSDANIGIATGKESGLLVLDVDTVKGGDESLQDLMALHAPLPQTMVQITGSGGRHYLFSCPDMPVRCSAGKLGKGLDIRANGGYIVAPPSHHKSGNVYRWANEIKPTPAPEWLLLLITNEKAHSANDAMDNGTGDDNAPTGAILEGERNNYLASIGGKLRRDGKGKNKHEILLCLLDENQKRCEPPLDDDEVRKIADSLGRYRKGPPPKEMKYQYIDWLRSPDSPVKPPSIRHILVDMTNWMDKDGRNCYPPMADIAAATGYSVKHVKESLKTAAQKGWINRHPYKGNGQRWANYVYSIPPCAYR